MTTALPPLIGLAHGSRDPRAKATIEELMVAVAAAVPGLVTRAAFLDLSEPDLSTVVAELGRPSVVMPLLFSRAFHAQADTPQAVAAATELTGLPLVTADILGMGEDVLAGLRRRADEAGIGEDTPIVLLAVGSSRKSANAAVVELARRWTEQRPATVTAAFATCAPRATEVLTELRAAGPRPAIVPLFLAPGLLLDQVVGADAAAGCTAAGVLSTALTGLLVDRYRQVASSVPDPVVPGTPQR